jgi:tetratricopeptide (TPR) repeat protein
VLEKDPDNLDALVMRAELSEVAPRGYGHFFTGGAGVREWEAVLATGDEEYVPLARQNLVRLYEENIRRSMMWHNFNEALDVCEKVLALQPDHDMIRARYITILYLTEAPEEKIEAEIARIDLSDQDALLLLIKFWLIVEEHDRIESFLKKIGPQDAEFYLEIGGFLLEKDEDDIAQTYFDKALNSVHKSDRKGIRANIGRQYAMAERGDEAARIWRGILKDDRHFGPAHFLLAIWERTRGNERAALRHLRHAERWALQNDDMKLLEGVKEERLTIQSPLTNLLADLPIDDMTPEEIVKTLQEAGISQEVFMDMLDEMDDQPRRRERPSARARRNRRGRGRGNWHKAQEDEE